MAISAGRRLSREQVLGFRVRTQQLDREQGTLTGTAILGVGVQDTGPDGGLWALANRGVDVSSLDGSELVTVWTIRGAPHLYRRADVNGIAAAAAPFSDADAGKRIYDASRPLKAAGIGNLAALDAVAEAMREVVTVPTVKGEMSRRVAERMPGPYLRECRPCNAVHLFEMPFRLAALRAGLELQPGTSPPVLQPIPGFAPAAEVEPGLDVVRNYLRLLGPATPQHVAGYLDAPVKDVKAHWPADAVEVTVDGQPRWLLADDLDRLDGDSTGATRLLGPFDLFLQAKDRALLADRDRAKALWPVLGRPGGVLLGGTVAGTWRARKTGSKLALTVDLWQPSDHRIQRAITDQAERLAAFRGLSLAGVEVTT